MAKQEMAPEDGADALDTFKYVDVSTRHISREDDERLHELALEEVHGGIAPTTIAEYQYGFFVGVPEEIDGEFERQMGVSDALIDLMRRCSAEGVQVIRIDRDGARHPGLPTFDW